MRAFLAVLCAILTVFSASAVAEEPARIYAAGSLGGVMPALIAASGIPADRFAPVVFGPAGLLRQRILQGEPADLFASADLAQPRRVVAEKGGIVVPFVRNRMCVLAPEKSGLTPGNLLDRLLSSRVRLATSTPQADPGGDYAWAVFDKAEKLHPGAKAALSAKALKLVGGPDSPKPLPGHSAVASIFLSNQADAILIYCSSTAAATREVPNMAAIPVPATLEVNPVYGFAILSKRPDIEQLALFILSEQGQKILAQAGLYPLADKP